MGKQKVETNGNYGKPSKEWTPPPPGGGGGVWPKPFPKANYEPNLFPSGILSFPFVFP